MSSVLVAIGLAILPGVTELHVRAVASALQLLGVAQVAYGIRETRQLFGRPGIVEHAREWWKRFPTGSKRIKVGAAQLSFEGNAAFSLDASLKHSTTASIEDRVGRLERDQEVLRARITQTQSEFLKKMDEHGKKLESEARMRDEADAATRKLVEATQTGGLAFSAAGAVWIAVGIILGAFPAEIAGCFGR